MTLQESQDRFLQLLREMKTEDERKQFLKWINVNWNLDNEGTYDKVLKAIAEEIRSIVPFNGILPSEKIEMPVCGPRLRPASDSVKIFSLHKPVSGLETYYRILQFRKRFRHFVVNEICDFPATLTDKNSDCKSHSTIHIDEFLYNDDDVDELVGRGELSRHYCGDCFSQNIKLLTFISHSMSINRIQYLFRYLLPPLENKTIFDVGSRFGGVLYGAYLYTSSSNIIGVEVNPELCKIQTDIVKKYNFNDRIKIICNSILNEMELLSTADVIILNNVFEFFSDVDKTVSSWHLLAENIKVGCLLVTVPHLSDTFQHLKLGFDWEDWVEELQPFQPDNFICDEETLENHQENVKHYRVKKKINLLKK